ncbi:MAG: hypothetical protein M1816_005754 [Peltula sp. TS41687]|nr:MAG: hypothetical protein M1816_005754 [Peltula sp. TS41687]
MKSYLQLVDECDNFPYPDAVPQFHPNHSAFPYFRLVHGPDTLGYLTAPVMTSLRKYAGVSPGNPRSSSEKPHDVLTIDEVGRTVTVPGNTVEARSQNVQNIVRVWKETAAFRVVAVAAENEELYAVYGSHGTLIFEIARSAASLFGLVTYGVHMTAFTKTAAANGLKIWVPRRSRLKNTYGGMLDNSVAGGIPSVESPLEALIRESAEEASLSEELVRKKAISCGSVSYLHIRDERAGGEVGLVQPEYQFVYDMELSEDEIPKPNDDEVESFHLMSVQEVERAMRSGEFKPNCAVVLVDFFVRHGILTPENEEDYAEIVARIHRKLDFPFSRGTSNRMMS